MTIITDVKVETWRSPSSGQYLIQVSNVVAGPKMPGVRAGFDDEVNR